MAYDYKKHFGEITLTQDLTTLPDERTWRLQAPERDAEPHQIVLYLGCNVLRTSHMIRRSPRSSTGSASTTSRSAARPTAAASSIIGTATPRPPAA